MEAVLDDNGMKEFIDMDVQKPTDPAEVEAWQKKRRNVEGFCWRA